MQNVESAMERLEQVVQDTRMALRAGNLAIMGDLAARTNDALSDLGGDVDAVRLAALRDLAQKNALALEAAGRGVRAARRRLAEIVSAQAGVQTYDVAGKTRHIGGPDGTLKTRL